MEMTPPPFWTMFKKTAELVTGGTPKNSQRSEIGVMAGELLPVAMFNFYSVFILSWTLNGIAFIFFL